MRGAVAIGGDDLPSPVRMGLTDLQNIGVARGPLGPPGSGTTGYYSKKPQCTSIHILTHTFGTQMKLNTQIYVLAV